MSTLSHKDEPNPAASPLTSTEAINPVRRFLELLVIPVVGLFIISRCRYGSSPGIDIWFVVVFLIYYGVSFLGRSSTGLRRITFLDWSLFIVVIIETACYLNSTYPANSLRDYNNVLLLFLFYCFVRLHLNREYQQLSIFATITLFGLYMSVAAIYSFYRQYGRITSLGFGDVTNFKQSFDFLQTNGTPLGEWVTLYLVLLPFPILLFIRFVNSASRSIWLLLCPVVTLLVIISATFSRGAYVATGVFFLSTVLLFRLQGLTALKRLIGFGLCALLLFTAITCATPLRGPVLTTALMFKTSSQVRSFQGRTGIWKESLQVAKNHPLFGVGASNFPMHYAAYKEVDSVYVSRTLNIFLQLLVEKGVVGLLAYCLLFFSFFKVSYENVKRARGSEFQKAVVVMFGALVVTLLVRDLSYSSVLISQGVGALLWFIFANNARGGAESESVSGSG
jgi:O-antigen ligase